MNGIGGWWTDWWESIVSPHEKAFERVFNEMITARNAIRQAFQQNEAAKARLAGFYAQFSGLPASAQRSAFRRLYQDIKSELDAGERRLTNLSTDLAVIQDAASKARAGTVPYETINDEVAVADIQTRGLEPGDIEAAKRQQAGWPAAIIGGAVALIVLLRAIPVAADTIKAVCAKSDEEMTKQNIQIARINAAMGIAPAYIEAPPSAVSDVATTVAAGVSIATIGLVGLVGWWLAKRA